MMRQITTVVVGVLIAACTSAQTTNDPYATPITEGHPAIEVGLVEFATIPNSDGETARMMLLVDGPGTGRLFVNDMRGPLYSVSYDGRTVTLYLDLHAPHWAVNVEASRNEQGFRASRFIHSLMRLTLQGSGSSTPSRTPVTHTRRPTSHQAAAVTPTIPCYSSGSLRTLRPSPTMVARHVNWFGSNNPFATTTAVTSPLTRFCHLVTQSSDCSTWVRLTAVVVATP